MQVLQEKKVVSIGEKEEIYCNCCGEKIEKLPSVDIFSDFLHIDKNWGYLSKKDLVTHSFNICECCYDKWISTFRIPIKERPHKELGGYTKEELNDLNEAYTHHLQRKNC